MNADLENLIVLQAQDLDLSRLRAEIAEAPRRFKTAEAALQVAERTVTALRDKLAAEEKLRRGQESEVATLRSKLERLRRSLNGATSAAQVSAFQHEIDFSELAISKTEDEELASLERSEALEAELKHTQAEHAQRTDALASERARAARVTAENQELVAGIEKQRHELRGQIEERWLAVYDRLSKAKGTAMAEALGNATQGKCSACQMSVRPQRWQDLTGRDHDDQIFTCETCGRMLFWDPRRDTPKAWEAGDRLRRAQTGNQAGSAR